MLFVGPKRGRPKSGAGRASRGRQGGQPNGRGRGRGRIEMVTARDAMALALAPSAPPPQPPPRTLLGKINSHLVCALCRGYFVDATTIVECLHTFCRSCVLKHLAVKSYCPVCEMMINAAKPNIKLDKTLQDIVYKLVPGLFRNEMARRRAFFAERPDAAAEATPEQRGEDTERVVFSPEDVISFSLEYVEGADVPDPEPQQPPPLDDDAPDSRRYLRCPAVVQVSHLKKFLALKFDVDESLFCVEVLYKRVPLPDHYTLMDVAYIYNWKRVEPMRFFYRIADVAKQPVPEPPKLPPSIPEPDGPDEDEKSQFLNSFELTAIGGISEKRSRSPPPPDEKDADAPEPKRRKPSVETPTPVATATETETPQPPAEEPAEKPPEPEKKKPEEPADVERTPEKKPEAPRLDPLPPKRKPAMEPGRLERSLAKMQQKPDKSTPEKKTTMEPPKAPAESDRNIRSLFDSCNINIPPSLSITLKDGEDSPPKTGEKPVPQNSAPKPKPPPEEGHLEIIKLPDAENPTAETSASSPIKPPAKPAATVAPSGAKGPVPNLKPISEAKLTSPSIKPQTFQQTFLQSLQQHKEKPKFNKARVVAPKPLEARDRPPAPPRPVAESAPFPKTAKADSALDLSAPHPPRAELGPQRAKALETMQSIAILADQRFNRQRSLAPSSFARTLPKPPQSALRVPAPPKPIGIAQIPPSNGAPKLFPNYYQPQKRPAARSPGDAGPSGSPIQREHVDRFQTRSPSSSPKLVIACPSPERRQFPPPRSRDGRNSPTSTSVEVKPAKKAQPPGRPSGSQTKPDESPAMRDFSRNEPTLAQSYLRQQLELQTHLGLLPPGAAAEWYNNPVARAHFEKVINNIRHNAQATYGINQVAKDK